MTWTTPRTWVDTTDTPDATMMNAHVRDQMRELPPYLTTATGDIVYADGANSLARLPAGSPSQVLTVSGGIPSWEYATGAILTINDEGGPGESAGYDLYNSDHVGADFFLLSSGFDLFAAGEGEFSYQARQTLAPATTIDWGTMTFDAPASGEVVYMLNLNIQGNGTDDSIAVVDSLQDEPGIIGCSRFYNPTLKEYATTTFLFSESGLTSGQSYTRYAVYAEQGSADFTNVHIVSAVCMVLQVAS